MRTTKCLLVELGNIISRTFLAGSTRKFWMHWLKKAERKRSMERITS
jgi:hypothetical protein